MSVESPTGSSRITASGIIGESGAPIYVTGISITSGATAGVATLRNGTTSSGTAYIAPTGTASQTVSPANFPADGIYFPGGLYVSIDANVTAAVIFYRQVVTV